MKIPIRQFKGLYTYIDPSDKSYEYFSKFRNIRVKPGYIEANSLRFTQQLMDIPEGHTLIRELIVFLDEDKYQNILIDNSLENNYIQNIKKYFFRITYFSGKYYFQTKEFGTTDWKVVYGPMSPFEDEADQYPYVINEHGILKILFKKRALWLGKINRTYWIFGNGNGEIRSSNFQVFPLVEPFVLDNTSKLFNFEVIQDTTVVEWVSVTASIIGQDVPFVHPNGHIFESLQIELRDEQGMRVPFSNYTGNVVLFKVTVSSIGPIPIGTYYAFWKGHTDIINHPTTAWHLTNQAALWHLDETEPNGDEYWLSSNFGLPEGWLLLRDIEQIEGWISQGFQINVQSGILENPFEAGQNIEVLTTVVIDNNEFVINSQSLGNSSSDFAIAITPNVANILDCYKNKISANIYLKYSKVTDIEAENDFELCHSIQFITGKQTYFGAKYINKLTPNGIFLTQMIGIYFNKDTYNIIINPEDYITINGTSFIIKNGNVIYPAVGGGSILNNVFYQQNTINEVEGQFFLEIDSKLAVFSKIVEEVTVLDYQPIESYMLFFVKAKYSYRLKDYYDSVETAEGLILNVPDGIYATTGQGRRLISQQINDICKRNWSNSAIYYNTYEKELIYVCNEGIYIYSFEMNAWSEHTINYKWIRGIINIEVPDSPNNGNNTDVFIIDIIDDYEGHLYAITAQGKFLLSYDSTAEGQMTIGRIDLNELTFKKVINHLAVDSIGKVTALNKRKETDTRKIKVLVKKHLERIPQDHLEFEIAFTKTLYNLELNYEAYPSLRF